MLDSGPQVYAHNIETVKRLQHPVRDPLASYEKSLRVLESAKEISPKTLTKSSIMIGFGEKLEEVCETMKDLRGVGVDVVTLGQYLQPTKAHHQVKEYVSEETFKGYENEAKRLGFLYVASGPLVRSSYRAGEFYIKNVLQKGVRHGS